MSGSVPAVDIGGTKVAADHYRQTPSLSLFLQVPRLCFEPLQAPCGFDRALQMAALAPPAMAGHRAISFRRSMR
ncbi:hypothetical protein ACQPYK_43600 [Streptosporangium sp. CA-135522]|uniref:hypothetical protein n=1 Tax=Streptosporangium sp. CA-135522 TaxID=3240072 RepID=UPI003D94C7BC